VEVCGQHEGPAALAPGKEPPVPTGQEVWWAPELVWKWWRKEHIPLSLLGNEHRSSSP